MPIMSVVRVPLTPSVAACAELLSHGPDAFFGFVWRGSWIFKKKKNMFHVDFGFFLRLGTGDRAFIGR